MSYKFSTIILTASIILSGCAQNSSKVQAAYVSPLQYEDYSCSQIRGEAGRISARASEAAGVQDKKAQNDAVATGVALVLFWPAALFIQGDKGNSAELARLKGQMDALEQVSIKKNCGIEFRQAPAEDA